MTDIYAINKDEIYISGVNTSDSKGVLLKGKSNGFETFITSGIISIENLFDKLYGELATVWIEPVGTIYTGGNTLFWNTNGKWAYVQTVKEIDRGFIYSISGNAGNDYVMVGDRNTLLHFNGIDWKQIGIEYDSASPIILHRVKQNGDIIAAVGSYNRQAIIIILQR